MLIIVFVVIPLVELAVYVQVAQWIGFLDTTLLLLLVSVIGIIIVRYQGLGVWRRVRAQLREGIVPAADLVNGLIILVAGLLLIVPGFVTDAVGLLLLLPPVRAFVRALVRRRYAVRVANRVVKVVNTRGTAPRDASVDVVEVLPPAPSALPPTPPVPGPESPGQDQ